MTEPNGDMKISQEQAKAIIVLVQAVQIAQKRGAYDLNEASQISEAVNLFVRKEDGENANTNDNSEQKPRVNDTTL
tara:strand:+ start:1064 stop:1291 length:228 start_codon:yes stop_codon:yes gene_type:complete